MSWSILPKLVVFDLDCTLWPFHVDSHYIPPFRKNKGIIYDHHGSKVTCYPDSTKVLEYLNNMGCDIAVASRTSEVNGAQQLIKLFDWEKYFKYKEIYPGCKKKHFENFRKLSSISYEEMLFFDDEYRNIRDLTEYKVTCILVDNGITMEVLKDGLKTYQDNHG